MESLVRSSVLLGVDGVSLGLGAACLLLQADLLFGRFQALGFGPLRGRFGGRLPCGPLSLGLRLGLLLLGLRPALGLLAVALGAKPALLLGDLVLETLALEFGLRTLTLELGLVLSLPRLLSPAVCLELGLRLRLLEAALPGQFLVAGHRPGRFLHPPGKLSE